jgi:peroxiredoxin
VEEVPLLQKIFTKYSSAGLMLISVSIDEDVDALKSMVARKGIKWPEVCDGKGTDSELVRIFNAQQATHFVIDREGKIAAKHKGANGLGRIESVVSRLLAETK